MLRVGPLAAAVVGKVLQVVVALRAGVAVPDVAVPDSCCTEMRELNALEGRVPLPDQCLAPVQVTIRNGAFSPETIHVKVGQTVRWLNGTDQTQSVIGGVPGAPRSDLLQSPDMAPNAVYARTFDRAGTLPYFSGHDDTLRGTLVVTE